MTSVLVLAGVWVLVGIPAIISILRERRTPDADFARAMDALGNGGPGVASRSGLSAARRRAQVSGTIYAMAVTLLAVGLAERALGLLAGGVALANLGTFYRIFVLRLRVVAAKRQSLGGRSRPSPAAVSVTASATPPPPTPPPPAGAKAPVLVG